MAMKKAASSVILACLLFTLSQCSLYELFLRERLGDLRITFYLRGVPERFPDNPNAPIPAGQSDYNWLVYMDLDGNLTTGDADGFDALLCLKYDAAIFGGGTHGESRQLSATGSSWDHDAVYFVDADQELIIVSGYSTWTELGGLNAGSRFRCSTTYYTSSGSQADTTPDFYGTGALIDAEGDLLDSGTYPFLDIVGITIEY